MPALKPKIRSDLSVVEMEGEAVIYDDLTNQIHYLNRTATIVFNLCDGRATIADFSRDIAEAFSLSQPEVERQVRALIRDFREAGFLEGTGGDSESPASSNGSRSSRAKTKKSSKRPPKGTRRS
ncbi:MAG: PqqD family protein [Actinomycetota bacterium]